MTEIPITTPVAMACPVCFGANDSPMEQATNMGIIVMLVIVAVVLVGFASFFVNLIRRARLADAALADPRSADATRYVPEEGTA